MMLGFDLQVIRSSTYMVNKSSGHPTTWSRSQEVNKSSNYMVNKSSGHPTTWSISNPVIQLHGL